ncbi:hypothetical protein SSX86_016874 [Deinandra increscens subsp. villosa]|uniref:SWIM-type domain-containing protein n=1 Tax=Deinandra increscens subsp. villosa TaxID=3103831 RepID=A0AAP0CU73_9ASTR
MESLDLRSASQIRNAHESNTNGSNQSVNLPAVRTDDTAASASEEFVDASSDFDINYVDSHSLLNIVNEPSMSVDESSTSSSTLPEPEPILSYFADEHRGGSSSRVFLTPNGTRFWKPNVDESLVPVIGTVFASWDDVVALYDTYAEESGFSTRLGTHRKVHDVTTSRIIKCNRSGKPLLKRFDSTDPAALSKFKSSRSQMCGCTACIHVKFDPESKSYTLYSFVDYHNHEMYGKEFIEFSKKRRKVDFTTHQFVHEMSLHKIGPNISHRVQCTLKGGHQNVRGTVTDYKNISRDIRIFIGDRDAQMILDTLRSRSENLHNFFFEYVVDGHELRSLFWADDVSRCNYETFGDVLAFDATYKTNKYCMIFVPFTGVDHHKKCVTFGAALLFDESTESYTWLLQTFLKAHGKQPRLVLTDQDAAMEKAIIAVFTSSTHRLCMWHIMRKLPANVKGGVVENTDLRKRIHKLVWNLIIDQDTFEEKWADLIDEFDLSSNTWLQQMFAIRSDWVPCYFRDIPMCCLMKTTSRCESSNALFKVNSSASNTLLQFLMCFDTSIDGQRYNQRKMEFDTNMTTPVLRTPSPIEKHASTLYTLSIFKEVQKEIDRSVNYCSIGETRILGDTKIYTVAHTNKQFKHVNQFEVTFDTVNHTVECGCMCFTRIGYLCRHVFHVFRFNQINRIPDRYISNRWLRNALPNRVYEIANRYSVDNSEAGVIRRDIMDTVCQCSDRLRRDPTRLAAFSNQLKDIKRQIFSEVPYNPEHERTSAIISDILHQPEFGTSTFKQPQGIRNKGCGTGKRMVGPGEKAVENFKKGPRFCKMCNQYVYGHDSRNCAKVQAALRAAAADSDTVGNSGCPGTSSGVSDLPLTHDTSTSVASSSHTRALRATRRAAARSAMQSTRVAEQSPTTRDI